MFDFVSEFISIAANIMIPFGLLMVGLVVGQLVSKVKKLESKIEDMQIVIGAMGLEQDARDLDAISSGKVTTQ